MLFLYLAINALQWRKFVKVSPEDVSLCLNICRGLPTAHAISSCSVIWMVLAFNILCLLHLVHRINNWKGSYSGCRVRCSHQTVGVFSSRRCLRNEKNALCGDPVSQFFRLMKFSIGVQSCWSNICVLQFCSVTVILFLRSLMKFCTYVPHFLTDLGEIWCNRCVGIPLNSCHVNHCSGSHTYGCKWYFSCLLLHFSSVLEKIKSRRWPYKCTGCEFPESRRSKYHALLIGWE
jgi:hypothetical protein